MSVIIEITSPREQTDSLLDSLKEDENLLSIKLERGVSLRPEGDVITVILPNRDLDRILTSLYKRFGFDEKELTLSVFRPGAILSSEWQEILTNDSSEATPEEMELMIAKESNMTAYTMGLMFLTGVIASLGLLADALHLVIGAMTLIPGFEPIMRIGFGAAYKSRAWKRGLSTTVIGYSLFIFGAWAMTVAVRLLGYKPLALRGSYLVSNVLIDYWTTVSAPAIAVTVAAGLVGAILIATNRPLLTLGVMIALGLVPSAAIIGISIAIFDAELLARGGLRFALETAIVAAVSWLFFSFKRKKTPWTSRR